MCDRIMSGPLTGLIRDKFLLNFWINKQSEAAWWNGRHPCQGQGPEDVVTLLTSCVTLHKTPELSDSAFSQIQNEDGVQHLPLPLTQGGC